jgi:hypothetical protein
VALVKLSYIISYFYFIYSFFVTVLMVDSGIGNLVYYETCYSLSLVKLSYIMPFSPFFSIMFVLYKSEEYYSVIWYEQEGGLLSESVKGERH